MSSRQCDKDKTSNIWSVFRWSNKTKEHLHKWIIEHIAIHLWSQECLSYLKPWRPHMLNFSFLKSYLKIYTEYQGEIFAHRLTMVAPWLRPAAARSLAADSLTVCAPSAALPPRLSPPSKTNSAYPFIHWQDPHPPTHLQLPPLECAHCWRKSSYKMKLFLLFHLNVKIAEYSMSNIDYVSEHKSH